MRDNDRQLGKPLRVYRDTKANIESLSLGAADEGCEAYATDTDEFGTFNGTSWIWGVPHEEFTPTQHDARDHSPVAGTFSLSELLTQAHTELTGVTADQHHVQLHKAAHVSAGGDAFASTDLLEAHVKRLLESGGPTTLLIGTVADGQYLKRSGTGIIGGTPTGGGSAPTGAIIAYGGTTAPDTWLICDGTAVSRTTYADLFGIIGTAYGVGDGSTTFNLPNLKQRFPLGKADAGTGSTLGGTGGAIDHTHTYSTVIAHIHSIDPPNTTSSSHSADHTHAMFHTHGVNPPNSLTDASAAHSHTSGLVEPGAGAYTTKQSVCGLAGSSIQTGQVAGHQHSIDIAEFTSGDSSAASTGGTSGGHTHNVDIAPFDSASVGDASGTTAAQNPPFQVVNYIIKT